MKLNKTYTQLSDTGVPIHHAQGHALIIKVAFFHCFPAVFTHCICFCC